MDRTYSVACLGLAFALSHATSTAQTAVPHGEIVRFMSDTQNEHGVGEEFRPQLGKPGTWPSVLVVPDANGLTDDLRLEAKRWSTYGYKVLVMDPYGSSSVATATEQAWTREANHSRNVEMVEYGITYLENWMMNPDELVLVGIGAGGTLATDTALAESNVRVLALIDGQPPFGPPAMAKLHASVFCSFSGSPAVVSKDVINASRSGLVAQHLENDMKVYGDVEPGFWAISNAAYNQQAAEDSEKRLKLFLATRLR